MTFFKNRKFSKNTFSKEVNFQKSVFFGKSDFFFENFRFLKNVIGFFFREKKFFVREIFIFLFLSYLIPKLSNFELIGCPEHGERTIRKNTHFFDLNAVWGPSGGPNLVDPLCINGKIIRYTFIAPLGAFVWQTFKNRCPSVRVRPDFLANHAGRTATVTSILGSYYTLQNFKK